MSGLATCVVFGVLIGGTGGFVLSRRLGAHRFWRVWAIFATLVVGIGFAWSFLISDAMAAGLYGLGLMAMMGLIPALLAAAVGGMIGGHRASLEPAE